MAPFHAAPRAPAGRRALPLVAAALALAAPAHADQALSLGAGWASFSTLGEPPMPRQAPPTLTSDFGGHLQATYEHGVSREVSLRGELALALFSGDGTSYLALADLGVVYRFDVVKYVPYGFAALGGLASTGGALDGVVDAVVVLGGGLDILSSRTRSWGVEARLASFAGDTTVFTLGVRTSLRWGFF